MCNVYDSVDASGDIIAGLDCVIPPCRYCCCAAVRILHQVSADLAERVHDSYILKDILGSDHVPLGVVIKKQ
jgi:hypothetical protein